MNRKNLFALILKSCLMMILGFTFASAQENKQTKPVVMILGTYHMGNPGRDLNNVKADDVRAEKRQREIANFIQVIKKFKPTKIAIEVEPQNAKIGERYAQYLKGEYQLKADEVDQIAFRLAKEINHPKLFQIDWQGNFDFDKVLASAKANNQSAMTDYFMMSGKKETEKLSEMMKTESVTDIFRYLNDENRVDEWHQFYLKVVRVGKDSDYAGTDLVSDWYERNLKIYANLTRITESPNDRILVLYGAGHLKLLQQFVKDSGEYDLELLSKYL